MAVPRAVAAWHSLSVEETLARVGGSLPEGLSHAEAARRLRRLGSNRLPGPGPPSAIRLFLRQFRDATMLVLLGATAVAYLLGEMADSLTILAIVILNACLGFFQEFRAERALQALQAMAAPEARVLRGGRLTRIPAAEVVVGDLLVLETGDRVPADGRLVSVANLEVDEAILTGESAPVRKQTSALAPATPLGDRRNMVFLGTTAVRGRGTAVVVATGVRTETGRIAGLIQAVGERDTPLQRRLAHLSQALVAVCLLVSLAVALAGMARGEPVYRMFLAGVSLAVAVIPEGLPAVVTIGLAVGVQRMLGRNAIIRRLPAVETLGCATVIACDKTGTLTESAMTVREVVAGGRRYQVSGTGYQPGGDFSRDGEPVRPDAEPGLALSLALGALASNARLQCLPGDDGKRASRATRRGRRAGRRTGDPGGRWTAEGDPTEGALVVAAAKAGFTPEYLARGWIRLGEVPFESGRRRMSVVVVPAAGPPGRREWWPGGPGQAVLVTKGAPDTLLALCSRSYTERGPNPLTAADRAGLRAAVDAMAGRALRVLAVAYRALDGSEVAAAQAGDGEELERDLTFVGLLGMMDPPRPEARKAIETCRRAGIRVIMITGDHPLTTRAIARDLGLGDGPVLTGAELDTMSDRALGRRLEEVSVYARVSPAHKLRLVQALSRQGHVVAMTGDGVNDAAAVKAADIGISMGPTGTDVTKEAASMILTDGNFASIVAAVEEGRAIYDNIRKFIRYLLSCNVGEVLVMLLAVLAGWPLPLTPIQILWVNLVTDGLPATALAMEPGASDLMDRPPRPPRESIFARRLGWRILVRGTLIGLASLAVFRLSLGPAWSAALASVGAGPEPPELAWARTMTFATLVGCQLFHVFDCRAEGSARPAPLWSNPWLLLSVIVSGAMLAGVVHHPALAPWFRTVPLSPLDWVLVGAASAVGGGGPALRRWILGRRPAGRAG